MTETKPARGSRARKAPKADTPHGKPHYEHVLRRVEALIPYVRNPRMHHDNDIAMIAGSIREFGFTNPCLIDQRNNLIAGHGRLEAARRLEMDEVPCIIVTGLSKTQRQALIIADNRLAEKSAWDNDMLAMELGELNEAGFSLDLVGFDDKDMAKLLGEDEPVIPDDFGPSDETIEAEHECPQCGFTWKGGKVTKSATGEPD